MLASEEVVRRLLTEGLADARALPKNFDPLVWRTVASRRLSTRRPKPSDRQRQQDKRGYPLK